MIQPHVFPGSDKMRQPWRSRPLLVASLFLLVARSAGAVVPTAEETAAGRQFVQSHLAQPKAPSDLPFSFTLDGKRSAELLFDWKRTQQDSSPAPGIVQSRLRWKDPVSGMVVECDVLGYAQFPAVAWTLSFRNEGPADSPLLADLRSLDVSWSGTGPCRVHHAKGSDASPSDYAPLSDEIGGEAPVRLFSQGWPTSLGSPSGSPSVEALPMFNLEWSGEGLLGGLGWTGPWTAEFQRLPDQRVQVRAGMEGVHLRLHPGEQIGTPRVLLLFWKGDRVRGHNLWRRLLQEHYSPRPGGKPFEGLLCDANWGSWMNAEKHLEEIAWWRDHQLPMECYWMDAGWTDMSRGWEAHQSQQVPNPALFPQGLRPVSDAARSRGMKFLLWMVPESVQPGVGIAAEHPEWLLKPFRYPQAFGEMTFYGLDHGDPTVNQFMIDHFSRVICEQGVDVFRQDGLSLWPEDTGPDRQGIRQIRYTLGFYAFWDELLKRHPEMLIDNCGCGGRKLDLETIRRSVLFWRSDCQASGDFDPVTSQAFTAGLMPWVPLQGGAVPMVHLSRYSFRSAYCPALVLGWPMRNVTDLVQDRWASVDLPLLRSLLNEYLQVRPCLFGDYYPLTEYNQDQDAWLAWQFDRPELRQGVVQAFRRPKSVTESTIYRLQGLDSAAAYELTDLDSGAVLQRTGKQLMEEGFLVRIAEQPGSAVVVYRRR